MYALSKMFVLYFIWQRIKMKSVGMGQMPADFSVWICFYRVVMEEIVLGR